MVMVPPLCKVIMSSTIGAMNAGTWSMLVVRNDDECTPTNTSSQNFAEMPNTRAKSRSGMAFKGLARFMLYNDGSASVLKIELIERTHATKRAHLAKSSANSVAKGEVGAPCAKYC